MPKVTALPWRLLPALLLPLLAIWALQTWELRPQAGSARVSIQQVVAHVPRGRDREEVAALASRRFGWGAPVVGTGQELLEHFAALAARGVERVYAWFTDFGDPDALLDFGDTVITPLARSVPSGP